MAGDVEQNPGPISYSSQNDISIFHVNIRSLRFKLATISEEISEYDIICFTETHLDDCVKDNELQLEHFQLYRRDRNCFGGGIGVYLSSLLHVTRRKDLESSVYEDMWFEIVLPQKRLLLCTVYRPPNTPVAYWDYLEYSLETALDYMPHIVLLGDLNEDLLSDNHHHLQDILTRKGLRNVIKEPTRATRLLDPVILSEDCTCTDSHVVEFSPDISDHNGVVVSLNKCINLKKCYKRNVLIYKNGNYEHLNDLIVSTNWLSLFDACQSVDAACDLFIDKLQHFVKECIPSQTVTIRPNDKPWFDSELRREIRIRDRLRKKARKTNSYRDVSKYKTQRNRVNNLKKSAKENFYANLDGLLATQLEKNSTNYWKLLRCLIKDSGSSTFIPPLVNMGCDNQNTPDAFSDYDKAEALNNYFVSISEINDEAASLPPFVKLCDDELSNAAIEEGEIRDIIMSLPVNKASGPDNVNHRLLKHISISISSPLCILFNISLESGKFPSQWKEANVMPLFKKGDKSLPSNYRPISLLSCISKLFERLIFKRMYNYFLHNNLLSKYQSGLCQTTVLHFSSLKFITKCAKPLMNVNCFV